MKASGYIQGLATDSRRIANEAGGELERPIPTCPGWSAGDLVVHLAAVYEWVGDIVESGATNYDRDVKDIASIARRIQARSVDRDFSSSPAAVDWYREQSDRIVRVLGSQEPEAPVWTWWPPDQTVGFWQRRMALETVVHLWDVLSAFESEEPIDTDTARDGIEEVVYIHLPAEYEGSSPHGKGENYQFHCSDCDGDWLVLFKGDDIRVTREQADADLNFTGTASDLLLFLWRRISPQRLSTYGNTAGFDRYYELLQVDS